MSSVVRESRSRSSTLVTSRLQRDLTPSSYTGIASALVDELE